ncbi:uncharacterized protein LOC124142636 isoform X4 [Haliotis rufescens]|uniref:uncharacterized protein LOC124142636 isoform X4 n=1 Tax=Haliotis rufescens TaxID=6454 RepID=UPI00201FA076|nr:uncharacterized protein LOC124142636 isoform X4 [Haliotis rufescens]
MSRIIIAAVCVLFAGISHAQDNPRFDVAGPDYVKEGDEINLSCTTDADVQFMASKQLAIVHKNLVTETETIISEQQSLLVTPAENYEIKLEMIPIVRVTLKIKSATAAADGEYTCRTQKTGTSDALESATKTVVFLGISHAQDNPRFDVPGPDYVKEGDEINLSCTTDANVQFIVSKQLAIVHKNLVTETETIISELQILLVTQADNYVIKLEMIPIVRVTLKLKSATAAADGEYTCRTQKRGTSDALESATKTVVFLGISHAQDNPRFDVPGPDYVKEGEEINLSCTTDADVQFMASKQLAIVHKNLVTETETIISEQQRLLVTPADNYVIKLEMIPIVRVTLKIKSATAAADGEYTCRTQKTGTSDALESTTKTVVFLAPVSGIKLTVDGEEKADGVTVSSKSKKLSVTCEAMGSNPAPVIYIMAGDQHINTGDVTAILDKDGNTERRSYKAMVSFELDFDHRLFNKVLKCHAEPDLPEGVTMESGDQTVSVTLEGIVDKPMVACSNKTASANDRRVILTCFVSKIPAVKSVMFNVGNRHLLYPGNQTKSLTEVVQKDFNATHNEVILKFFEMEEWHFTANIYLDVKGLDDQVFQYPVYLIRGISHVQDNPRFDVTGPDYVKEGDEINLSCTTDADVQFMASKQLAIVHKNLVTETETIISEQQRLLVSPADNYVIKFEMIPIVRVILKIKSATAAADGEYTCRTQKRGTSDALESATKTVVFLGISHAQDNPRFDVTGPDYVKEGDEINLSCTTDADVEFMASKQLAIVHKNLVTETETIISEQMSILVTPADNYMIKLEIIPIVRVTLKIKSATAAADGEYTCRTQKTETSDALESATKTVVFLGISHVQDNPRFDVTGPDYVKEGDEINLSCTTDADVQFMASKQLAIVHKNLVTETETIISEQQRLLVSPADNYVIKFEMIPIVRVILKIKSATAAADGEYTCRTQKRGTSDALESATKTVVFLGISHAQDNPRFDVTGPDYVKEGEEINLSCTTDADVQFMASKQLAIVHRNLVTETETIISEQQSLLVSPADNYVIKFEMIPIVRVILKIKSATAAADGEYTCRTQKRGTSDALDSATKTVVFLGISHAQDNPRFDVTGPDYVKEGEEINLSCTTDADVQFMASKQLAIVHRNLVTETETIISEQQSLLVSPADNYVIKFEMIPIVRVILKIKSATAAADGEYTCRTQKRGTSDALESATKTVVFLGISHAQDNPRFDVTGPDYVKEGEEINLSCTTDADVQFMASKQLAIVHRNLVTETETTISEQQSLLVSPADNYVIKFEMIPIVRVILKIKSATAAADGEYTCRTQKRGTSDALESATKTVVFLGISHAQDNPRFDVTGPDYVKEGEEINLSCTTDADVQFMASKQLAIVHRNLVTETETIISEQQSLLVSPADNYVIKFEMIPIVRVILKIKSATAAADGEYTCRTQKRGTSDALESATKTVVFLGISHAQDNPRFDVTGPDYVKEGEEINLSCTTDADVQFMASKQLAIVHRNLVTETETIISEQQSLLVSPADNYVIKFEMIPIVRVILKIKSATAAADGEYTCRTQKRGTSDALESATKTVVFLGISHAQDNPRFDVTGPDYVKEGEEINLSCTTDADVQFMASKQLAIVHRNLVTETETTISEQQSLLVSPADNYVIKFEMIPIVRVILKIKSATAAADGEYTCRTQKRGTSDALESATKTVVFLVSAAQDLNGATSLTGTTTLSIVCLLAGVLQKV